MNRVYKIISLSLIIAGFMSMHVCASDLKQAAMFRKSHQYDQALATVNQYLNKSPDDRDGLFIKGLILSDLKRYSESIAIFQKLIKAYPATPELHNNLAIVLAFSGKYEDSQKAFQKALHLLHTYRAAHKNLDALKFAISYHKHLKKKTTFSKQHVLESMQFKSKSTDNQMNSRTCRKLLDTQMLIRQIQTGLSKLGYYKGKIDGTFQSHTQTGIKDFQRFHQIPINGSISWQLLARIQDTIDEKKIVSSYQKKLSLPQLRMDRLTEKIQHGLYDLGYSPGPQNGKFHQQTQQALSKFIKDHSIKDVPKISFSISGHIMKALYNIQGKWTIVPIVENESCTHFVPLVTYIDNGYKPIDYIGYATILKHNTRNNIMIANSSANCRDMQRLISAKKYKP